ncbi:NERD domain-containing protein kinase family protein [Thalassotalea agarivorans]|uniref:Protein kinase domain-containing protein n=1 Tax=Thalassotalea agarivorans TaxID=349064 RepID=A0A1I0EQL6_THASX|nr:NERD domain-containing protein kinase family protein [Thalassotalea agarivorans]SET47087.1 Protein kinase domain-containing protein [Thalassotalea agarivorans]
MAKHIPFGDPVNHAESWAFNLLKKQLPDNYVLLTNVEIPKKSGQAMEVDALVVGEWGVYVVDVKGYMGQLEAGLHAWTLDGHQVENSLSKANYVARVLAGNIRKKAPYGVFPPWCQGMVFVTGREGDAIDLHKDAGDLSIYTPQNIVSALTQEWGSTADRKFNVSEQQKKVVLDTIGQVALMEKRAKKVQDFQKTLCLYQRNGIEIWQAEYNLGGWKTDWLLKILIAADFEDEASYRQQCNMLTEQLKRLQALSGCSGVPLCSSIIDDGEQMVLPIKIPQGRPIQFFDPLSVDHNQRVSILRRAATSLQQIHGSGYSVSNWADNQVFISEQGDVEFIDIENTKTMQEDLQSFAQSFEKFAQHIDSPLVTLWFAKAIKGEWISLDELRAELSTTLMQHKLSKNAQSSSDDILNGRYKLVERIREGDNSEIWQARHLLGNFDCSVVLYKNVSESWLGLSDSYRRIKSLYHPNIERIIEFGRCPDRNELFLSKEWVTGETLRDLKGTLSPEQAGLWFDQLHQALGYLHQFDIFHGGISLANIVAHHEKATFVNFGLGLDAIAKKDVRQKVDVDEEIWSVEDEGIRDIFSLAASFIIALSEQAIPETLTLESLEQMKQGLDPTFLTETRGQIIEDALRIIKV